MGRFPASFFVIAILDLACQPIEQPITGPTTLTTEWQTITPPEPLRIAGRAQQTVWLEIVGTLTDIDLDDGVVVNGQRHVIGGEVTDAKQTPFALKVSGDAGNRVFLSRAGTPPRGPDFPDDIILLRLRSEPGLQVERIWWYSVDQH